VTVRSDVTRENAATGTGSARVLGSTFVVGEMQYGVLLVHQERATVADNDISVAPRQSPPPTFVERLRNPDLLRAARAALVSGAELAKEQPVTTVDRPEGQALAGSEPPAAAEQTTAKTATSPRPARAPITVAVGNQTMAFMSHSGLQSAWQTYFEQNPPGTLASQRDALRVLQQTADRVLTDPAVGQQISAFSEAVRAIAASDVPVAQRGIAVGGQAITDLRIHQNTIAGVLQGITVGVSQREPKVDDAVYDVTQTVSIRDNSVEVVLGLLAKTAARFGIFVGNCQSLQIDGNRLAMTPSAAGYLPSDGIRVWGYLGPKVVVRHNHVSTFTTGIRVVAMGGVGVQLQTPPRTASPPVYTATINFGPQWLVADNLLDGIKDAIEAPACLLVANAAW
jgi:hypothetical protein